MIDGDGGVCRRVARPLRAPANSFAGAPLRPRGLARPALLASLLLLLGVAGCNEHPLVDLGRQVRIQRSDIYPQARRTEIDVLWVVDNSSSMCEEQASLSAQFNSFIEGLAGLQASFHLGVVATEVDEDRAQVAGRFRYAPARTNSQHCVNYVACSRDAHCGTGGCLCGVPWMRRCNADSECDAGETCLRHALPGGGQTALSYCSKTCTAETDCQGDIASAARTLHCLEGHCQLDTCQLDEDCPSGQRCLAAEGEAGAISFCRRFRAPGITCTPGAVGAPCPLDTVCGADGQCEPVGFCPPQTCDCPKSLPTTIAFDPDPAAPVEQQLGLDELRHRFRCLALLGTDGDTYEKGLEAAERALTPPLAVQGGANAGFLREDAYLVVIFISDENDCSDRGKPCTQNADCPDPENARCTPDPVEPGKRYCRLPKRETQECQYWRDRLMDTGELAATFKDLKASPALADGRACTQQSDCAAAENRYCSPKFGKCTRDPGRIITAAIVGDRDLFCTSGCPTDDDRACEASEACEPCAQGEFCAERVYGMGTHVEAPTCQHPTYGSAYSGRRYDEFLQQFGNHAVGLSVCRGQIGDALQSIAGLVASVVPTSWCLGEPLPTCRTDADCRGRGACLTDAAVLGGSPPFCVKPEPAGGEGTARYQPSELILEVKKLDGQARTVVPADWHFLPGPITYRVGATRGEGAGGCIAFDEHAPAAGESLVLRYATPLDPGR